MIKPGEYNPHSPIDPSSIKHHLSVESGWLLVNPDGRFDMSNTIRRFPKSWGYPNSWMVYLMINALKKSMLGGNPMLRNHHIETFDD